MKRPWQTFLLIAFITGLAIACLFPVGTGGHGSRRLSCLSNLKQQTLGMIMYSSDVDDLLPPYFTFDGQVATEKYMEALQPYTRNPQIFLCPSLTGDPEVRSKATPIETVTDKMSFVHANFLKSLIPKFVDGKRVLNLQTLSVDPKDVSYVRDCLVANTERQFRHAPFLSAHGQLFNVACLDGHVHPRPSLSPNTDW